MNNSDSDYISVVSSDTDSVSSIETDIISGDFTEEDWLEIYELADELVVELLRENVIKISNANIFKDISTEVMNILYESIGHLFENEDDPIISEIQCLVDQIIELEMEQMDIPKRTLTMTIDTLDEMDETKITIMKKQIETLRNIPQPEQRTKEWYEFRYNLLSASNAWKAFGSQAQCNSLIYEKCKPLDLSTIQYSNSMYSGAMHWGVKYEPITTMVYEDMYQTTIEEFGCVQHSVYNYIGASPDGINVNPNNGRYGRMLEIKNIVNREITGIPKTEYWIQTQLQMETCNLEYCDFVETRFKEYNTEEEFYGDISREYKGVILHFIERPNLENDPLTFYKPGAPIYIYKPLDIENDQSKISEWIDMKKTELNNKNCALFNTIYWYMDEFSCVLIQRNRQWFASAVSKLGDVWETILAERETGYEHRSAKKRIPKIDVNMNDLSNSYITNISQKNNMCLIKLDENGDII